MKKLGMILMAIVFTASMVGCNTMKGAGKDMENTGKNVQKTVNHNE